MIAAHVSVEVRLDPILPGVTDGADRLEAICAALARVGVRKIAASVLFLRPAVIGSLRRHVEDTLMLNRLLDRFASASLWRSMRATAGSGRFQLPRVLKSSSA